MIDREVSAGAVVAYLLWGLTVVLCVGAWVLGDINVGRLSILTCGAAVTATVRTYFVDQAQRIKLALMVTATVREGEPARGRGTVRPLR